MKSTVKELVPSSAAILLEYTRSLPKKLLRVLAPLYLIKRVRLVRIYKLSASITSFEAILDVSLNP